MSGSGLRDTFRNVKPVKKDDRGMKTGPSSTGYYGLFEEEPHGGICLSDTELGALCTAGLWEMPNGVPNRLTINHVLSLIQPKSSASS